MTTDNNQPPFSETTLDFTSSSAKILLASGDSWAFGYGDFTIEAWVHCSDLSETGDYLDDKVIFGSLARSQGEHQFLFYVRYDGELGFWNDRTACGGGKLENDTWHHVALVRRNLRIYMYLDGRLVYTGCDITEYKQKDGFSVGAVYDPFLTTTDKWSRSFGGYMQDLRVSKGHAVYTCNFVLAKSLLNKCSVADRCPPPCNPTEQQAILAGNNNNTLPNIFKTTADDAFWSGTKSIQMDGTCTGLTVAYSSSDENVVSVGSYAEIQADVHWQYGASNGPCLPTGGITLNPVAVGTATITASQAGDCTYHAATSKTFTVTVGLATTPTPTPLDFGQIQLTYDSVSEITLNIQDNADYVGTSGITIDWGGGDVQTYSQSNDTSNITKTYTDTAPRTVTITGELLKFGQNNALNFPNCLTATFEGMGSITDCREMFGNCNSITSVDLSNFDSSNVTTFDMAFINCSSLTSLDMSNLNTSNVWMMTSMFFGVSNITTLDVSSFDTSNVTRMDQMFRNCTKLTSIVGHENWDVSSCSNQFAMFHNTPALTNDNVNFDSWCVSSISSTPNNFNDGAGFTEEPNWGASC